ACARVVGVAGEGPVRGAARHVGERRAEVEQVGQILAVHAVRGAGGAVCVAIVDAGEAVDVDGGGGLADGDGRVAGCRRVVRVAGERPMRGAARDVGERCAEVEQVGQILARHAVGGTGGAVRVAIVDAAVAVHGHGGAGGGDDDGRVAGGRRVVRVAAEGPVRG